MVLIDLFIILTTLAIIFLNRHSAINQLMTDNPNFLPGLIISYAVIGLPFITITLWRAIQSFYSKSIVFLPHKVFFLVNENLIWETEYHQLKNIEVFRSKRNQKLIRKINIIINNPPENKIHTITFQQLSQDKLTDIVKAFQDRSIRISRVY